MEDASIVPAAAVAERVDRRHWRVVDGALRARFATGDFATGLTFVARVGEAAESAQHHPDLDLRYPYVEARLVSHDAGGLTERDIALAGEITRIADELGIAAQDD